MVLKKKIFEYFSMYFYGLNLQPLPRSHLGPWDLHLNQIGKGPLGHATIQIMTKKIFEYFSMHFYGLNLGPPGAGLSWTLGPSFEQTWYRTTMQCYIPNFKHSKPNSSEEEHFLIFYMYFYGLNLGPPAARPSWNLGPSFEQTC